MPIVALLSMLLVASPAGAPVPASAPAPTASAALSPDALFSRRALRRAKLLIQMRVMQLRDEQLECIREALLRRLPGALWSEVPSPSRGTPNLAAAAARCAEDVRL